MPDLETIIKQYLEKNSFDGLYDAGCWSICYCEISNLFDNCEDRPNMSCCGGYQTKENGIWYNRDA